ncbi:phosphatidylserine decarboxylase family protein [bacterium]|nr:MAG: phosphatidylserine decarboxylase family protein [bacterium]
MVTEYGYGVIAAVCGIALVVGAASWFFLDVNWIRFAISAVAALAVIFTISFFRDPERTTPPGDNLVISPADGEVVLIKPVDEDEYLKKKGTQISIFMSPFNVHVNRWPISGTVEYFRHFPGEYLVAYEEKSSVRNERTHIGVRGARTSVLFKQIAGYVARRIVADVKEGDCAVAGTRFGMIKFGSRVDVIVPASAEIRVALGDRTVAGETVLAIVQ